MSQPPPSLPPAPQYPPPPPAGYQPAPAAAGGPGMKKPAIIAAITAGVVIVGGLGAFVATSLGKDDPPLNCAQVPLPEGCPNPTGATGPDTTGPDTTGSTGPVTGATGPVTGATGPVTGATGPVTGATGTVTGATGTVTGATGTVTGATGATGGVPVGDPYVIGGGQATVTVPSDWEVVGNDDTTIALFDPFGDWVFFEVFSYDGSVEASTAAQEFFQVQLQENESYSNLQPSDPVPLFDPFGSVTGSSYVYYKGTWTTQQGAVEVEGYVGTCVKADGTVLFFWVESAGEWIPERMDGIFNTVVGPAAGSFGAT